MWIIWYCFLIHLFCEKKQTNNYIDLITVYIVTVKVGSEDSEFLLKYHISLNFMLKSKWPLCGWPPYWNVHPYMQLQLLLVFLPISLNCQSFASGRWDSLAGYIKGILIKYLVGRFNKVVSHRMVIYFSKYFIDKCDILVKVHFPPGQLYCNDVQRVNKYVKINQVNWRSVKVNKLVKSDYAVARR